MENEIELKAMFRDEFTDEYLQAVSTNTQDAVELMYMAYVRGYTKYSNDLNKLKSELSSYRQALADQERYGGL